MVINKKKYKLTKGNFYEGNHKKTQIVLGNTFTTKDYHIQGWKHRMGGDYKKTSIYTIMRDGKIFQHFDPKNYSDFIGDKSIDKKIISILLENQGWLKRDFNNDLYFNWVGNIYKKVDDVYVKRWRGFTYWDTYSEEQMKSSVDLINFLSETYKIPKKCVSHNTYIDSIEYFEGVTYKSNHIKESTDLNPSWDFKKFKNMVENNNEKN
tara:strand:- start:429 stop:1052 length:624 start_codon:yes stop_codon:yes gene_type:complete